MTHLGNFQSVDGTRILNFACSTIHSENDYDQSLRTGRPPFFTPNFIDVEVPEDYQAYVEDDGTKVQSGAFLHIR